MLIGGIIGINVFVVLLIGIVSGSVIMLATGEIAASGLLASMGSGAAGMFETTMVAILVAAICALIREYGGFEALLRGIREHILTLPDDTLLLSGHSAPTTPAEERGRSWYLV